MKRPTKQMLACADFALDFEDGAFPHVKAAADRLSKQYAKVLFTELFSAFERDGQWVFFSDPDESEMTWMTNTESGPFGFEFPVLLTVNPKNLLSSITNQIYAGMCEEDASLLLEAISRWERALEIAKKRVKRAIAKPTKSALS